MGWKLIIVACCMLQPIPGHVMSRQDIADFVEYIERTSRPDRQMILKEGRSNSESEEEEEEGNAWEDGDKFEGDVILNSRQRRRIIQDVISGGNVRNGYRSLSKRWPKKLVIYSIRKAHFSPEQRKAIENAIEILANVSCVKFRKYKNGDNHSVVVEGKGNGCYSSIGFQKSHQVLNLSAKNAVGAGCLRTGTIIHEFLHALGFFHMHCNPNRDKYVRVHWENIKPDKRTNFLKYRSDEITDFGVEYEYYSIMHYSRKARTVNGKDTIEPLKDTTFNKAQREAMTESDIRKLNLMYCEKNIKGR